MSIARHGLKKLLPPTVNLISGPGCPICVTPVEYIDLAIQLSSINDVIVTTFGDMYNVPGSKSNMAKEHAKGSDIRIVYSSHDSLDIAEYNPKKEVVFLGVGFETTSPTIAATILAAKQRKIENFSVLPMFKVIPPALKEILNIKERKIDAFLLPGHVSTIIGSKPYDFISRDYGIPGVISGFEPQDILNSVDMIIAQIKSNRAKIEIQYKRSVEPSGNKTAQNILKKVYKIVDSNWRGIGKMPKSGMTLNKDFEEFDASKRFKLKVKKAPEPKGCLCGKVLLGLKAPKDCALFGNACTPGDPIGPCMVSSEGTCAAEYKYG